MACRSDSLGALAQICSRKGHEHNGPSRPGERGRSGWASQGGAGRDATPGRFRCQYGGLGSTPARRGSRVRQRRLHLRAGQPKVSGPGSLQPFHREIGHRRKGARATTAGSPFTYVRQPTPVLANRSKKLPDPIYSRTPSEAHNEKGSENQDARGQMPSVAPLSA